MTNPSPKPIHKIYYHPKNNPTLEEKIILFLSEHTKSFLNAAFPKKYYSYTWLARQMFGLDLKLDDMFQNELRKSIENALYRLKEKGLIYKDKNRKNILWKLTNKGEDYVKIINQIKQIIPPEDNIVRIFVFDIPEKQRKIRDFIRTELISFGYTMLQKSVWLGKRPLPLSFVKSIKEKGLFKNIHLFEIKEGGTLDDLIIEENNNFT